MATNSNGVEGMAKLNVRNLTINTKVWNEEAEETVVLLHGFTGSVATWEQVVKALPTTIRIMAIDLTGHGQTDIPLNYARYEMTEQVKDLEALFEALNVNNFTLLGYSMGGRVALSYAAQYPKRIKQLILESASPGLASEAERKTRRDADFALATKIEKNGITSFVDAWENIQLFASQKKLSEEVKNAVRKERLAQSEIGIANSLRGLGTGEQPSLWGKLSSITLPVTLITGALDEKFCLIAKTMLKSLPNAQHLVINDMGHAIHVENPVQFATIVKDIIIQ